MPSISPPSEATLYDGRSAHAWRVTVEPDITGLRLVHADGRVEIVAAALLTRGRDGPGGRAVLRRADVDDWRLALDTPAALAATLPRADRTSRSHTARYAAAIAATLALAAGAWFQGGALLETLAPLVPRSVAEEVGASLAGQLGAGEPCRSPAGDAALARLTARVAGAAGPAATVSIARGPLVNAFAAPGGRVVLFEGLIDKAKSPDEVAGVLAHELAHVRAKHPEQAMIRYFGVSIIAGALGGDVGSVADLALLFANTRAKEAQADLRAVEALRAANIAPEGLARFLERLAAQDAPAPAGRDRVRRALDRAAGYASTHPGGGSRAAAIRAAAAPPAPAPALTPADWAALRAICARPTPGRTTPTPRNRP